MSQDFWLEERRSGNVIDVGPIEQPAVVAEVNLFVAGAEFDERDLNTRKQPLGND